VVVGIVTLALLLWQIVDALLLAFAAVLLAVFLRGCAHRLCAHTPLSIHWALLVVGLTLLALLGTFGYLVGPSLINQFSALMQRLPEAIRHIQHNLQQSEWGQFVLRYLTARPGELSQSASFFSRMTGLASTAFGLLTNLILILFAGIYFATNPALYQPGLLLLSPPRQIPRVRAALDATGQAL
jgi:predicted PurR-regulated permease PerM